jgi:hypothetical protein
MKYLAFIFIPLGLFFATHLAFAYGQWDINPKNWDEDIRQLAAIFGVLTFVGGFFIAGNIDYPKKREE